MPVPHEVLLTADQIASRVSAMAQEIRRDVPRDLHLVTVLKGGFVFLADLMRQIDGEVSVDFLALSSYTAGTNSSGTVRLLKDLDLPVEGRDVVIVEDIVDTGVTLAYLQAVLHARRPRTLRTACLLDKPSRRQAGVAVEYIGFTVPDRFVVGYGLDYGERYRNLPYIAAID